LGDTTKATFGTPSWDQKSQVQESADTPMPSRRTAKVIEPLRKSTGAINVQGTMRKMAVGESFVMPAVMACPHHAARKAGIKVKTQRKGNKRIVERVS
jgi:hypothetical protein